MSDILLKVIPKPDGKKVTIFRGPTPLISGMGNNNLLCGSCDAVLAKSVFKKQMRDISLKCDNCNAYNLI